MRRILLIIGSLLVATLVVGVAGQKGFGPFADKLASSSSDGTKVPVVGDTNGDGVLNAAEADALNVPVRGKEAPSTSWGALATTFSKDKAYQACVRKVIGVDLTQVANLIAQEKATPGGSALFIKASNFGGNDARIREIVAAEAKRAGIGDDVRNSVHIDRVKSVTNTRWTKKDQCETFVDDTPMVRFAIGKMVKVDNMWKVDYGHFVYVTCHNPGKNAPKTTTPPATLTSTTHTTGPLKSTPPRTTTATPTGKTCPGGKPVPSNGLCPKDPGKDPAKQGNSGNGGGLNTGLDNLPSPPQPATTSRSNPVSITTTAPVTSHEAPRVTVQPDAKPSTSVAHSEQPRETNTHVVAPSANSSGEGGSIFGG